MERWGSKRGDRLIELNKVYNEDCLEGMKRVPDKSIDMILCDLPYGTTQNNWDSVIPLDELWKHYKRIIKERGAIVLTAQTPFDKVLGMSNLKWLKYELIWEKSKATGYLNARRMPLKAHENILVFYNKTPKYNPQMTKGKPYKNRHKAGDTGNNYGENKKEYSYENEGTRFPRSVLKFDSIKTNEQLHPTQKPVELFEWLIKTFTDEGEIVLDNAMGSGTTAIAALNTNRKYIGFESNIDYFNIINNRIKSHFETNSIKNDKLHI